MAINAQFLGKDVVEMKKCAYVEGQSDLMNRLIHRSWGETFVALIYETQ
ncbi:MAG: hypothetical protein EWM73_02268 [Nitrospira sp.]|nr:MAG: hypothetical protein EWM73_02268 [Nitrospira sp.]